MSFQQHDNILPHGRGLARKKSRSSSERPKLPKAPISSKHPKAPILTYSDTKKDFASSWIFPARPEIWGIFCL